MYIGIDIGGTSVKWGILDNNLNVLEKSSFKTSKESDLKLLDDISRLVNEKKEQYDFKYVGVGAPGFVDTEKGIIKGSANTPFKCTEAEEILREKIHLPVILGNDANCAAYGEFSFSQEASKNLVLLTLGTGVGGGIVTDGKIYTGKTGYAGELGHMIILKDGEKCNCGKKGCFETYASATALVRMAKKRMNKENGSLSGVKIPFGKLDGKVIFNLAENENPAAIEVIKEYCSYLATGISNIEMIFEPDRIVLAGGITNHEKVLMNNLAPYLTDVIGKVSVSKLKNDAGFIGASLLGKQYK